MPQHTIDTNDIEYPLTIEKDMAGSYGKGSHKTLVCSVCVSGDTSIDVCGDASFIVRQHNEEVGRYLSIHKAIEHYNRLP